MQPPTQQLSPTTGILCNPESAIDPCRIRNSGRLIDFYGYLNSLSSAHTLGYVFPGNVSLAKKFGVSVRTIERWIARLVAIGAVSLEILNGLERRIRLLVSLPTLREMLLRGVAAVARVARSVRSHVAGDVRGLPIESMERRNNKQPAAPVVVSDPPEPPDPGIVAQAEAAAKLYAAKHAVRSWPALLHVAIRDKWTPAPAIAHASDSGDRPVRIVKAPADWSLRRKDAPSDAHKPESGAIPGIAADTGLARIAQICQRRVPVS